MLRKRTDGPISRYINRRFSLPITHFIVEHNIPITPNQMTVISFLVGITAASFYFLGLTLIAGILVQLSSILDGVDGELARATNRESPFGGFIDALLDRLVDIAIICGLAYIVIKSNLNLITSIVVLFAISGTLMVSYLHAASERNLKIHAARIGVIPSFASRDVRLFIIFVGSILGFYFETLLIIALITYLYVITKLFDLIKHYKQIQLITSRASHSEAMNAHAQ